MGPVPGPEAGNVRGNRKIEREYFGMDNPLILYQAVIADIKNIISSGQKEAYNATNKAMLFT